MAYGNVVGYQPVEGSPGAYKFQLANGDEPLFFGNEAESLKQKVDAADQNRQLLASNDANMSSAPAEVADVAPNMSPNPAPAPPPAAAGGMSSVNEDPSRGMSVAPDQPAPPAQPAMSANPGPAPKPDPYAGYSSVNQNGVNTGYVRAPNGQVGTITAGSAGSKGGLAQRSEQRSGGFDPSQEYIDHQNDLYLKQQAANEVAMGAAQQQAEQQRTFMAEQEKQLAIDQAEAQKKQAQIESKVGDLQMKYEKAAKAFTSSDAPHDDRDIGERLFDALAVGLGSFGAALSKSPNFAQQMVSQRIANNIHAQEVALNVKKDSANNALGDLQRELGSMDLAKTGLRGIRLQQAKTQFDKIAASTADERIRAGALQTSAKLESDYAATMEDYRLKALGQVSKSYVMTPKIAPTKAGFHALAPDKALGFAKESAGLEGTVAGTAKTLDSIGKGGKTQSDKNAAGAVSTADTALKSLSAYKDDEVPQTLDNQDLASSLYHRSKDLVLGAGSSARGMTEKDRALIQDTEAARGYVKSLSSVLSGQGALSGPESAAADRGLAPGATVGELRRAVAILRGRAQNILDAGGTVDVPATPETTE